MERSDGMKSDRKKIRVGESNADLHSSHCAENASPTSRRRKAFAKQWIKNQASKQTRVDCVIFDAMVSGDTSQRPHSHKISSDPSTYLYSTDRPTHNARFVFSRNNTILSLPGENSITNLIRSKSWPELLFHLDSAEGITKINSLKVGNYANPLHLAIFFDSPSYIIDRLCYLRPEFASCTNQRGQVPLHIACSCQRFKPRPHTTSRTMNALSTLLSTDPSTATLEDDDGMSPIELAIMSNFHEKEVRFLRMVSENYHKQQGGRDQICVRTARESSPNKRRFVVSCVEDEATGGVSGAQQSFSRLTMWGRPQQSSDLAASTNEHYQSTTAMEGASSGEDPSESVVDRNSDGREDCKVVDSGSPSTCIPSLKSKRQNTFQAGAA